MKNYGQLMQKEEVYTSFAICFRAGLVPVFVCPQSVLAYAQLIFRSAFELGFWL